MLAPLYIIIDREEYVFLPLAIWKDGNSLMTESEPVIEESP